MSEAVAEVLEVVSPVPENSRQKVWEWLNWYAFQTLDTASPQTLEQFIEKDERDRANGGKTFGILREDKLVGAIWFEHVGDGLGLGHLVFDPDRKHKIPRPDKLEACKQALRELFAAGFRKVVWSFYADNRMFKQFLDGLGATHEGLMREHVHRGYEVVDMALMASFPEGK